LKVDFSFSFLPNYLNRVRDLPVTFGELIGAWSGPCQEEKTCPQVVFESEIVRVLCFNRSRPITSWTTVAT